MLDDNEFSVNKEGSFLTFRKVSFSKAMLLIPVFFLTLIAVVHIQQHPLKTLAVILAIAFFTKIVWIRLTRKVHFQIDFSDRTFKFYDYNGNLQWNYLNDINEISWSSRFMEEFSHPDKHINKEHEVAIKLKLNNGKILTVFKLSSYSAEPSPEIMEIYTYVENAIKDIRVI